MFFLCAFAPLHEILSLNPLITRLLLAACALAGIYYLARLLTNRQVAVATVICFALYPVFLSEILLTQGREMAGHMGLLALTLCGLLAMARPPLFDDKVERPRINVRAQIVMAVIIVAYVITQFFKGGAARDILPVIPFVMLIWISTLYRRVRAWRWVVGIICIGFLLALIFK